MRFTVFGFSQQKAIEYGLDTRDLMLIDYIWDMCGSPTMQHIQDGNIIYVWLMHDRILNDLPILGIGKRALIDCLNKLKSLGLLYCKVINNDSSRGSKSFYAITEKCEVLRYDQVQNFAVSQRPGAKNCTSNNTSISNISNTNNQQVLLDNTNKEDTYKIKAQKFVDNFNKICVSLPKCVRLTPKRIKSISALLKKYSEEEILEVFNKLEASDFCTGRSGGSWRADIEFILREDKFISVLEGKYDNRGRRCNVETISRGDRRQLSPEERERIINNGKKF